MDHTFDVTARVAIFVCMFLLMLLLEWKLPCRKLSQNKMRRFTTNLSLSFTSGIVLKLLLPAGAIGAALFASQQQIGLFNTLDAPFWLAALITLLLLDLLIYWQHVATHHFRFLWAFHQIHHADRDIDVSTGIRFHPAEILISMLYKMLCILLIGPSVIAVLIFEILLNACALFNHANLQLPKRVDQWLRKIIVTPDMHRVHHSTNSQETNSNYGFSLSCWDKLFGSYIAQPKAGHQAMEIGLPQYQNKQPNGLLWSLLKPFRSPPFCKPSNKPFTKPNPRK